jgi:dTDP-4-amino-4,6-dideoxygalactose transaminase
MFKVDWPSRGHNYTETEINAAVEVMRGDNIPLSQAGRVQQFEQKFGKYIHANHIFATMSCAHALDITAMLLEIKPGDEIILPAHTYCATALAFARRGALLRWADIDPNYWTMSPESVVKRYTKKTKAIVMVNLYGLLSPHIEEIALFAKEKRVALVEDCAQSLGARKDERHSGTFGDIGCYSFHAQKNLTTLGEGGMIIVQDENLARKVSGLRLNGHAAFEGQTEYWLPAMTNVDKDIEGVWPMKSSMSDVQAAVGVKLLDKLDGFTKQRRARGLAFRKALQGYPELRFQGIPTPEAHSHHLMPAICESKKWNRDDLIKILSEKYGVKAIVQYYPLNRYDLFKQCGFGEADIPETDKFFDNMISFPFSIVIEEEDFNYMIKSVQQAIQHLREN